MSNAEKSNLWSMIKTPLQGSVFYKPRICRVLKVPMGYMCGVCGSRYRSQASAWKCVTIDAKNISSIPIDRLESNGNPFFRCLLCGKHYVNGEDAAICMSRDLKISKVPKELGEILSKLILFCLNNLAKTKRDALLTRQTAYGISAVSESQDQEPTEDFSEALNKIHKEVHSKKAQKENDD